MVVACGSNGYSEEFLVIIHGLDYRNKEKKELCAVIRRCARIKQVVTGIGNHGPVVMFA